MKLKKFRLSDDYFIDFYLKVAGGLVLVIIGCKVGKMVAINHEEKQNQTIEYNMDVEPKEYEIGEHIVIEPIDDPTKENMQYEYHKGYKPIGMTASARGQYAGAVDEAYVIYENECPVLVRPTNNDEYNTFGYPIDYTEKVQNETLDTKTFNEGEHIISVPLDKFDETTKIEFHDGYEIVGVCDSAYGKYSHIEAGGSVLYVNTEPVEVNKTTSENNSYTTFGTPIEEEKQKTKE